MALSRPTNYADEDDLISNEETANQADGRANLPDNVSMSTSLRQVQDPNHPIYTSQWATLFIIVNVTIGVGLLAMPFAMQTAGIVTSIIAQLFFLALTIITCIMCIELTVKSEVGSYHEIIERHCSRFAYQFTQASILLICYGSAVAYIVTIGDQSDRLFSTLYGQNFSETWYLNRKFIMSFFTVLFIKPLCSARTVDFLKYASFLGILSIGFIFVVVAINFKHATNVPSPKYYPGSWADIAFIMPVFCLAYQCHLSLVPVIATIHPRQKPKAFVTLSIAMIVTMLIYSSVSVLAVLSFGALIKKDLIENFSGSDWATLGTIVIVALKCILTVPAAYLPARLSLVDILSATFSRFGRCSEAFKRISVTIVSLNLALINAIFAPNILVVVNLLGCLAVLFVFVLPSMAYLNLVKENRLEKQRGVGGEADIPLYTSKDKMKRMTSYSMIVFGFFMTGVVTYESIKEMIDG
uniref:Putative sodium-coupled neutral amino acid transporter 7 n=1 Tax=Aceria tosichella TaxID=561515 RepID=A0A6G1SCE4_9ACAR